MSEHLPQAHSREQSRSGIQTQLPAVLADAGEQAGRRVIEFFTAEIRNTNTRRAYGRAVQQFFDWAADRGLTLKTIEPVHVASYVEQDDRAPATVKQLIGYIPPLRLAGNRTGDPAQSGCAGPTAETRRR